MSLSTAFNVISSSFAANAAQPLSFRATSPTSIRTGIARDRQCLTNSMAAPMSHRSPARPTPRCSTARARPRKPGAARDFRRTRDARPDRRRQFIGLGASGADQNGASPFAMLANLQSALTTTQTRPASSSAADAVVSAASDLASSLNSGSAAVQGVRETGRPKHGLVGGTINSLLNQFTAANDAIVTGLQTGPMSRAPRTHAMMVTQLAQQLGVSTTVAANGSESIYTDSGVTLFQDIPRAVSFTPTPTWSMARMAARSPSTACRSPAPIRQCPFNRARSPVMRRCGIARARISGPARPDRRRPHQRLRRNRSVGDSYAASLPGLFTTPGATSLPSMTATTGLAAAIEVNPNADPSQGGDRDLLRDGDISDPGNPAYTYNTRRGELSGTYRAAFGQISATQTFDPSAGLGSSASLTDYANASVGWVQGREPAGERRFLLSERARNSGQLRAIERDRRQSRCRNDQHAEPRELLRFHGEAADHCQRHVLNPFAGGVTTVGANFVSTHYLANSLVPPVMQAQSRSLPR